MTRKPDKRLTIHAPADVYEDFFLQTRKQGKSMNWRIVEWMHQQTGHPVPAPPKRGGITKPKSRK